MTKLAVIKKRQEVCELAGVDSLIEFKHKYPHLVMNLNLETTASWTYILGQVKKELEAQKELDELTCILMDEEQSKSDNALVVSVKVEQEMVDQLNSLPDKSQFIRDALKAALSQLDK